MEPLGVDVRNAAAAVIDIVNDAMAEVTRLDDADLSEYVVRVRWIKSVPLSQAVREPGLFGNQNCVAEPRDAKWPYTIDRLKQHFGIKD